MSKYTITPWRTQADLLSVRSQLYSTDDAARRRAVDRVMAWKLRGNLPHAVESTALLVEAQLHHRLQITSSSGSSSFSIRAVYSAAFTRFVTGFCDIGRAKERTLEPSSMLDIAKQIGMPPEFVALRHEATHEEMPGLKRLVEAAEKALEWLWEVYWSRLEEPESEEAVQTALKAFKAEVTTLLREFRRARRDALRNRAATAVGEAGDAVTIGARCVEMCQGRRAKIGALAEILVEERLILPSSRELGSSLQGAYLIWDDLLVLLCTRLSVFRTALATSLLQGVTASTATDAAKDVDKEAFAMWILYIATHEVYRPARIQEQHALLSAVMKWCCLHPGHWTRQIGQQVLEASDEDIRDEWSDLFEASLIRADVDAAMGASQDPVMLDPNPNQESTAGAEDAVHTTRGWSRAIAPAAVPIGVVE